jgi:hypothetical protein
MTERPFVPSIQDRLGLPHRQNPLVRSDLASRTNGVNRQRPGPILGQTRLRNAETATFNQQDNASAAAPSPTDSALSP